MQIHIKRADAPHAPEEILAELASLSPRVFMEWNPMVAKSTDYRDTYEGRWEIWCELVHSTHPKAKNERQKTDRWNTDEQCWMRKLQVYQTEDRGYAPVDRGLLIGLRMADTWANRRFYEENVEIPYDLGEAAQSAVSREAIMAGGSYYNNFNNPTVGRHSKGGNWRWRNR